MRSDILVKKPSNTLDGQTEVNIGQKISDSALIIK